MLKIDLPSKNKEGGKGNNVEGSEEVGTQNGAAVQAQLAALANQVGELNKARKESAAVKSEESEAEDAEEALQLAGKNIAGQPFSAPPKIKFALFRKIKGQVLKYGTNSIDFMRNF